VSSHMFPLILSPLLTLSYLNYDSYFVTKSTLLVSQSTLLLLLILTKLYYRFPSCCLILKIQLEFLINSPLSFHTLMSLNLIIFTGITIVLINSRHLNVELLSHYSLNSSCVSFLILSLLIKNILFISFLFCSPLVLFILHAIIFAHKFLCNSQLLV